jgi:beta-galactosidase/beta-glucuronidase
MSDGTQRTLDLRGKTRRLPVEGPWKTTGEQDDGFTLVRQTEFTLPADFGKGQPVVLDLGDVQVMAKVTLNGKTYDTLWMPPFELDVTEDVQPGNNRLSVTVTSTSKGKPKIGAVTLRTVLEGEIGN